jgi:hypothetical protein
MLEQDIKRRTPKTASTQILWHLTKQRRLSLKPRTAKEDLKGLLNAKVGLETSLSLLRTEALKLAPPRVPKDRSWVKCGAMYSLIAATSTLLAPIGSFQKVRNFLMVLTEDAR